MPKVSIVIPTHNREKFLPRVIASVKGQTYKDYELIIIDDASSDNTVDILKAAHCRYYVLPRNTGSSAIPRNVGIRLAAGKYIALLDSDDEWMPAALQELVRKMDSVPESTGVIYGGICIKNNGRKSIFLHPKKRGNLYPEMLGHCVGSISACLIRSSCFNEVGAFDEKASPHWDMWIRLAQQYEFDYTPGVIANIHLHNEQYTSGDLSTTTEYVLEKYKEEFVKYPEQKGEVLSNLGLRYLRNGRRAEGIKKILPNMRFIKGWKNYILIAATLVHPKIYILLLKIYTIAIEKAKQKTGVQDTNKK